MLPDVSFWMRTISSQPLAEWIPGKVRAAWKRNTVANGDPVCNALRESATETILPALGGER